MPTLYVQEQGTTVRKRALQIVVTKDDKVLQAVPLTAVDQVVLMGRGVQLSTALLVDLLERGIPVTLTNEHANRHYATLTAGPSRFGELRVRQTLLVQNPARALELARDIVLTKVANQSATLRATGWAAAKAADGQFAAALAGARTARTLDTLRGHEGAAAAAYFGAWRASLPPAWGFAGRAYHPPPDPVNALLSFGYTLALHDVLVAVQVVGLDPYLGTFHRLAPGTPSLALDLLEEFRPVVVDRLALDLLRTGAITPVHFARARADRGAVHLNGSGRTLVIDRYEALLQSRVALPDGQHSALRRVLLLQAQTLARVVRGEQARYSGFMPRA